MQIKNMTHLDIAILQTCVAASSVLGEITDADERLLARAAHVRPVKVCVACVVPPQLGCLRKCLRAHGARIRSCASVALHVLAHVRAIGEALVANGT